MKRRKEQKRRAKPAHKALTRDDIEVGNIYAPDRNRMQLLQNLNSIKLLQIAEQFSMYPDSTVTIEEFIEIMSEALKDSAISDNDNFI